MANSHVISRITIQKKIYFAYNIPYVTSVYLTYSIIRYIIFPLLKSTEIEMKLNHKVKNIMHRIDDGNLDKKINMT